MRPEVLILASRYDLTCDLVVAQLRQKGVSYFRLNSEDFDRYRIVSEPDVPLVIVRIGGLDVQLSSDHLNSVYFRRGVYPRDPAISNISPDEQFNRSHRSAFMRSFMMFDRCKWINHPVATYRAEHKAVQLSAARKFGFAVPRTVITNDSTGIAKVANNDRAVAVKGLETVIAREGDAETFGYTSIISVAEARRAYMSSAPLIAQEALEHKLDLRATVVGDQVFCAEVLLRGGRIRGDWRLEKIDAEFRPHRLPADVNDACVRLTKAFGLALAGIDLALQGDRYFFLEINPTGEWGWLVDECRFPIDEEIVNSLLNVR